MNLKQQAEAITMGHIFCEEGGFDFDEMINELRDNDTIPDSVNVWAPFENYSPTALAVEMENYAETLEWQLQRVTQPLVDALRSVVTAIEVGNVAQIQSAGSDAKKLLETLDVGASSQSDLQSAHPEDGLFVIKASNDHTTDYFVTSATSLEAAIAEAKSDLPAGVLVEESSLYEVSRERLCLLSGGVASSDLMTF